MKNDKRYAVALILFIVISVSLLFFVAGVFYLRENPLFESEKSEGRIKEIDTNEIQISTKEFMKINFTSLKYNMNQAGFDWRNFTYGNKTGYIAEKQIVDDGFLVIEIYLNNSTNTSYLVGYYSLTCSKPQYFLQEKENSIKESMEKVAEICGISVDIGSIEWTVYYTSSWPTDC